MNKLILSTFFISFNIFANHAVVKMIRGDVTKLTPGSHNASKVKQGDKLPEDTSVLTGKASIIKVEMQDKSIVSLGPQSKIVIGSVSADKKKPNMIGFLKGVVRAEVEKSGAQANNKMIIQTRTAAMGIRGTKLKTSYNPDTRTTSLVTIEGKVAMVKVKEKEIIKEATDEVREENKDSKISKNEIQEKIKEKELEKIEEALNDSEKAVEVKQGRYASANIKLEKATRPAKVAPKQMVALATKDELAVEKVDAEKYEKELIKDFEKSADDEKAEEVFNESEGELKPKDGGLVDFDSGIYVPPSKEAKLDEKKQIYVADEKIGKVDNAGEYIPPTVLKLDAKKGFVVNTKEVKVADRSKLEESVALLNDRVKEQVVSESEIKQEIKAEIAMVSNKPAEKINQTKAASSDKDTFLGVEDFYFKFNAAPIAYKMIVRNTASDSKNSFVSDHGLRAQSAFYQKWGLSENLRTWLGLGFDYINFSSNERNVPNQTDQRFFPELSVNASYSMPSNSLLLLNIGFKEIPYIDIDNTSSKILYKSMMSPRLRLAYERMLIDKESLNLSATLGLSAIGTRSFQGHNGGEIESQSGFGSDLILSTNYKFNSGFALNASTFFEYEDQDVDVNEYTRYVLGVGAQFVWDI